MTSNPHKNQLPVSTRAEIHLDRLDHNITTISNRLGQVEMIGVVKANAYGHGSVEVSERLVRHGVKKLAVATVAEAISLRQAGISAYIIVFAPPMADRIGLYHEWNLEAIVDSEVSLSVIESFKTPLVSHVKVDTGMGRLGQNPTASADLIRAVDRSPIALMSSIWTHFSNADVPDSDFTAIQFDRFMQLMTALGGAPAPLHSAASAAAFSYAPSIDPSVMRFARIGIALYGLLDLPSARPPEGLLPVMEFISTVSAVKTVPAGTPISYGMRWTSPIETRIATISAGYADGVPRPLTNKGAVRIDGRMYPIVGTVCMDMFMVDLGPESETASEVAVGDKAIIFGQNSPTCFEVADLCSSITYVQVCGISSRVPRNYFS